MDYYRLSSKEVVDKLKSNEKGLDRLEVSKRLFKFGKNKLIRTRKFEWLKVFLEQFKSFLIIILIFAAILAFFMESKIDAIVILAIIFLNAGIGFFQEFKAERAIEKLQDMMVPHSKVIRNGEIVKIDSEDIVPGDILVLDEGDKVMADSRIISLDGLKVNESSLTGESVPVVKILNKLNKSVALADRTNMVYQGTEIVYGSALAIVVNTGMNTELGRISTLVQEVKREKNPFKDKLDRFSKKIGLFILSLSVLIIILLMSAGSNFLDSILVAISLAVSAIPEGLPAVISLGLAFATRRMISKNVLIRRLPASETLGRATVICTDKTGTLTKEEMEVSEIYANGKMNPSKNELLFKIGILCNHARLSNEGGKEVYLGDPTEIALIKAGKNNFLDQAELLNSEEKIKEFPFDSNRKMMSVIRKFEDKQISYVKGAPERIVERANYEFINGKKIKLDSVGRKRLINVYEKMAGSGLRVLGFAYNEVDKLNQKSAENDLIFVGFQGMIDPPRKEVKEAIRLCNQAGIKVLMVTGDSQLTANAVAEKIGLKGDSINSEELDKMSDSELLKRIDKIAVFSRISPEDKLRIIDILKEKNEIVAMTGDGVNDALALKRADIGIAMGIRGTDVARDSADIVLVNDNFASIVEGIREGRTVYDNIKKFIKLLLSANFSEVVLVLLVMLIWRNPEFLPLLPLQILWINLVTDSFPALALSFEKAEKNIMERMPSQKDILNGIKGFILLGGFIAFVIGFLFFYMNLDNMDKARTMVVTSSIVFEMFLAFNCKSEGSVFKSPVNKYLIGAVLLSIGLHLIVLYTPLNALFYFVSLGLNDWLFIIGVSVIGFLIVEGYKSFGRRNS
jgi:P-type Ca2+ transporter type 2C